MAFARPSSLGDAVGRIIVSTASATMMTGFVVEKLGMDPNETETLMGVSFAIGFLGWNLLGAVALYFSKREGKDVKELFKEVNK